MNARLLEALFRMKDADVWTSQVGDGAESIQLRLGAICGTTRFFLTPPLTRNMSVVSDLDSDASTWMLYCDEGAGTEALGAVSVADVADVVPDYLRALILQVTEFATLELDGLERSAESGALSSCLAQARAQCQAVEEWERKQYGPVDLDHLQPSQVRDRRILVVDGRESLLLEFLDGAVAVLATLPDGGGWALSDSVDPDRAGVLLSAGEALLYADDSHLDWVHRQTRRAIISSRRRVAALTSRSSALGHAELSDLSVLSSTLAEMIKAIDDPFADFEMPVGMSVAGGEAC